MKENQKIIQVNKEDLHELLIGFTDAHRDSQSKFWAEVKEDMKEMKESLGEIEKWQSGIEGGRKALVWASVAGIGLVSYIFLSQNDRINVISTQLTKHVEAQQSR